MALTASTLIDDAIARAYGNMGPQKINKAMLLGELSYQDQLVMQMLSQIAPDSLSTTTGVVTLTSSGNTNGYNLNSGIHYRDFTHVDSTDNVYTPVNMVQRQHRDSYPTSPAAMLSLSVTGGKLHPIDPEGKRWNTSGDREWFEPNSGHTISYSYVPLPSRVTTLTQTLSSPDMAREVIVSSLELQLIMSSSQPSETRMQGALLKRQGAMDALRMQAYKFMAPQGQPGGRLGERSDQAWVNSQVG